MCSWAARTLPLREAIYRKSLRLRGAWQHPTPPLMQHALFGLLTAILALKRPYLAFDLWVQRSPHKIGLSPTMRAGNRLSGGWPNVRR